MTRRPETVAQAAAPRRSQREHQRERTRAALVDGARTVIRSGEDVAMPAIARAAGVSEPTAYRYFPDLLSVLQEGFVGVWPSADELMPDHASCPDPVERAAAAAQVLASNVLRIEGAVRSMIALTIARRDAADARPAHRTGLIESALAPLAHHDGDRLAQLRNELSFAISAEALFTLLDLRRLTPEQAIDAMSESARHLVRMAIADLGL